MEQTLTQAPSILNMNILNYLLSEYGANFHPGSLDTKYKYIKLFIINIWSKLLPRLLAPSILNMNMLNYLLSIYGANFHPGSLDTKYEYIKLFIFNIWSKLSPRLPRYLTWIY